MTATSVREPVDLGGASEPELTRLLTSETAVEHDAVDQIAWQMLQGAQNLRRWIWTVVLVALALLVVGLVLSPP
jgi:hypothetical protein